MKILSIIIGTVLSFTIHAQNISGSVKVSKLNQTLAFANIQLSNKDGRVIKIAITNDAGLFKIENVPSDFYTIRVSFIGYQTYSDSIVVDSSDIDLGIIELEPYSKELAMVEIEEEKPIIEMKADKMVFNVSKDLTTSGDDGIELLRKAPGIQIDNEDNIIIDGKSGVIVYINGRQNYLQGEDLSNFLKTLQADNIESVEIITQPSAKYDAAGGAGIINIILKRQKGLGTKGNVSSTYTLGDFGRNTAVVNLNHRSKKASFFGSFTNYTGSNTYIQNLDRVQSGNIFDSQSNNKYTKRNNDLKIGGDYYLTNNSTISSVISIANNDQDRITQSNTLISNQTDGLLDSTLNSNNFVETGVTNLNANVNYTFKDTLDRQFSIDVDYVAYKQERITLQPNTYSSSSGEFLRQNDNYQETPIDINVVSVKMDYEFNLGQGKLGLGVKHASVETHNVFDFYSQNGSTRILDTLRSNTFNYREDVSAGYLNYQVKKGKWDYQGGIRIENTFSKGDLIALLSQQAQTVERNYINWFPSFGFSYQLNKMNALSFQYSKRINRPNYQNLNPFEYQIDELNFRKGNPFLQPQFAHNLKLSNTYKYKLTTSLSYSYVSNFSSDVRQAIGENSTFITTLNAADQRLINFSLSYPLKIKSWWNVYFNASAMHNSFSENLSAFNSIEQTNFNLFAQNTFKLKKGYQIGINGWYTDGSIWGGTYQLQSMGALNIALQKQWSAWSFKVSVNDIFHTIPWRGSTDFGGLLVHASGRPDSRNLRLFLSYNFGYKDVKDERKRKLGSENEINRIQDF